MSDSPASGHFETGSLTQRAPQQTEFIGSSSGVHFIKLVRAGFTDEPIGVRHALREDGIVGEDDDDPDDATDRNSGLPPLPRANAPVLCDYLAASNDSSPLPSREEAQTMVVEYFQSWHPLLPFLYGPTFMRELDNLYLRTQSSSRTGSHKFLLRCLFAVITPSTTSISPADTLAITGHLASRNDLLTVQAILMAQLRCVSAMALRMASSHSGLLSRMLLHAGLHRCPYRYEQLDDVSKDLRKRIFWSAYILDRYLSQALGLPPAIADSDIDVCAPGCSEIHSSKTVAGSANTVGSLVPNHGLHHHQRTPSFIPSPGRPSELCTASSEQTHSPDQQEFLFGHLVKHAQLVSRVLEIFHKSIHIRSVEKDKVLRIRADTNQWLNSLPHWPPRPGRPVLDQMGRPIKPEQSNFIPFLHILQQQLLIAIHRPYLSLPRSSAEFENSLQLVIRAARQTNTLLSEIDDYFWPGYLASAWMSGLLLIFACQNKAFSREQAVREINECLQTLQRMQSRWKGASRCHKALSALVITLTKTGDQEDTANAHPSSKRMQLHDEGDHVTPDPKRPCPSWSGISRDSGEGSSLPVAATTGLNWQNGTSILQTDIQPDFGIGTGDIFQNISWDGDFSSIDQFAMNGYSQDWLE